MADLICCEFVKLRRKPLFYASALTSALMPFAYALFLAQADNNVDAVEGIMASLFQLSAYLLLMPVVSVLAANLMFEEQDNDTMKNLLAIPIDPGKLAMAKMAVLFLFSIGFMAVGGLLNLAVLILQGWEPEGFWKLFFAGLGEGAVMWMGALPCIMLVTALNKSYIISVIITFFYTAANYLFATNDAFIMEPYGMNLGTLLSGPLSTRWIFQFYSYKDASPETAAFLDRISPYFVSGSQVFVVAAAEGVVFLGLIAWIYRKQKY